MANPKIQIRVREIPTHPIAGEMVFTPDEVMANGIGNNALVDIPDVDDLQAVRVFMDGWKAHKYEMYYYDWPESEPPKKTAKATKAAKAAESVEPVEPVEAEAANDEQPAIE